MKFNLKAKIRVNGKEYGSAEEMPAKIREAYTRAIGETALLRSGARLATKLNAKIIFNGVEYSSPGEMPVAERRLYQDTLAALIPEPTALSAHDASKLKQKKLLTALLMVSAIATAAYLWLHGFLG
ncbi:MAG: hypothetical protein QOE73_1145 [Verrucomicrobiota bacterium]|jgi:hypothetical protein